MSNIQHIIDGDTGEQAAGKINAVIDVVNNLEPDTGTTNFLSKFTDATTLGDSQIFDNGTNVGIGTTSPNAKLDVAADILVNSITVGRGEGNIGTNTVVGLNVLSSNSSGGQNTAVGRDALNSNTTGSSNIAVGSKALVLNTTGGANIAVGSTALYYNRTGGSNIAVGQDAGRRILNDSNNITTNDSIFIGQDTRALANNETNQIVIGHAAVGAGSNSVVLGNDSINKTILKGSAGIGTTTPNDSAVLDVTSTTKGFLPPRMTTAQKNAIASPAEGLMVYDTDLKKTFTFNGTTWESIKGLSWDFLVAKWSVEPTELATSASGVVWEYTLENTTRYRLVPTPYDPTQDAFFEGFDGTTLTNLITTRG